jgi:hypothetical protein
MHAMAKVMSACMDIKRLQHLIVILYYDVTGKLEALYEDPNHHLQQYIPKKESDIELEECPAYAENRKDDIKLEECPAYGEHPIQGRLRYLI